MKKLTAIIEFCEETQQYLAYIPGINGAHTVADSLDELNFNLNEVLDLLKEDEQMNWKSSYSFLSF